MTYSTFEPLVSAIQAVISPTAIINILAGAAGVAIIFVLFWWGARKIKSIIMKASLKGKLSI